VITKPKNRLREIIEETDQEIEARNQPHAVKVAAQKAIGKAFPFDVKNPLAVAATASDAANALNSRKKLMGFGANVFDGATLLGFGDKVWGNFAVGPNMNVGKFEFEYPFGSLGSLQKSCADIIETRQRNFERASEDFRNIKNEYRGKHPRAAMVGRNAGNVLGMAGLAKGGVSKRVAGGIDALTAAGSKIIDGMRNEGKSFTATLPVATLKGVVSFAGNRLPSFVNSKKMSGTFGSFLKFGEGTAKNVAKEQAISGITNVFANNEFSEIDSSTEER